MGMRICPVAGPRSGLQETRLPMHRIIRIKGKFPTDLSLSVRSADHAQISGGP